MIRVVLAAGQGHQGDGNGKNSFHKRKNSVFIDITPPKRKYCALFQIKTQTGVEREHQRGLGAVGDEVRLGKTIGQFRLEIEVGPRADPVLDTGKRPRGPLQARFFTIDSAHGRGDAFLCLDAKTGIQVKSVPGP